MEFNQNIYNIIIGIILIFILKKKLFNNVFENLSSDDQQSVRDLIRAEYQIDVQAIRNLGELAKQIKDADGKLVLPYNVEIRGNLEMGGNIALNDNQIKFRTLTDRNHKIYYEATGNKVVLQSFNKVELNTTQGNGTINIQKPLQVNGTGTFGNAKIGSRPSNANQVCFGHKDKFGDKYFLMDKDGNNFINGNEGKAVTLEGHLITNNVEVNGNIEATGTGTFGYAKIGTAPRLPTGGLRGDLCCFAHKDMFDSNTNNFNRNLFMSRDNRNNIFTTSKLYLDHSLNQPSLIFLSRPVWGGTYQNAIAMLSNGYLSFVSTKDHAFNHAHKASNNSFWNNTLVKT